jgi:hypothetical protein
MTMSGGFSNRMSDDALLISQYIQDNVLELQIA